MVKVKKTAAVAAQAAVPAVVDTKKTKAPKKTKAAAAAVVEEKPAVVEAAVAAAPAKIGKNKKKSLKRAAEKAQPKQPAAKVARRVVEEDAASVASDSDSDDDEAELKAPLVGSDDEEEAIEEPEPSASEDEEEAADEKADDTNIAVDSDSKKKSTGISVFVGNLPSNIKRDRLIKLFKPHAAVSAVRFRRNDGGQLFNVKLTELDSIIAFVDVPTEAEGLAASAALNGTEVGAHILRVNLQRNSKTAEQMDEKRTICVGNLAYKVTDELLRETFECCGEIEYVRTLQTAQGCKGLGFVCFAEPASVQMAFELNGGLLLERPVRVERYRANKKPSAAKTEKRHASFAAQRRLAAKANGGEDKGKFSKFQKSQGGKPVKGGGAEAGAEGKKKNKSEFAGEKTTANKKKSGDKKKKGGLKGEKLLAKKIAPRAKTESA